MDFTFFIYKFGFSRFGSLDVGRQVKIKVQWVDPQISISFKHSNTTTEVYIIAQNFGSSNTGQAQLPESLGIHEHGDRCTFLAMIGDLVL